MLYLKLIGVSTVKTATLNLPDGQSIELPVITGSENEKAVDIGKLRAQRTIRSRAAGSEQKGQSGCMEGPCLVVFP